MIKLVDPYPASSNISLNGSLFSKLNIHWSASSVFTTSKFVSLMICIMTTSAFCGIWTLKRTVNMIICKVLTKPHKYYSRPDRNMLVMMLDPANTLAAVSVVLIAASTTL